MSSGVGSLESYLLDLCERPVTEAELMEAELAFVDTIGVALAAAHEPMVGVVAAWVAPFSCDAPADVVDGAALLLGVAGHCLDFDDTELQGKVHPSASLVATILPLAGTLHASGRRLLEAYVVGLRVTHALGGVQQPGLHLRGYHPTATVMPVASAAAAGALVGLDRDHLGHALAVSTSLAGGTREVFGTMMKSMHAGLSATRGFFAARAAAAGIEGPARFLSGPSGYLFAHAGTIPSVEEMETTRRTARLLPKLFPCGHYAHAAIEATLEARRSLGFTSAADVESAHVLASSQCVATLNHPQAGTPLEGKFSLPYCVALAAHRGAVEAVDFTPEGFGDPEVMRLSTDVTVESSDRFDRGPDFASEVRVRLKDGREETFCVEHLAGEAERPVNARQIYDKFRAIVPAATRSEAEDLLSRLSSIGDADDTCDLASTLLVRLRSEARHA